MIILHNIRLAKNKKYHQEFTDYYFAGEYLPNYFIFWYEQYRYEHFEGEKHTYFDVWNGDTSEENLKRIDANRRKYYLKGVNSWTIRKGRKKNNPLEKW